MAAQKKVVFVRVSKLIADRIKSRASALGLSVNRYCEAAIGLELLVGESAAVLEVAALAATRSDCFVPD